MQALSIALITVSDSRTAATDASGDYLAEALQQQGHRLAERALVPDEMYQLRALVARLIAEPQVQVVLMTGGTGFAARDITPEAIVPLLDRQILGFGELFRAESVADVGAATMQSRALAGIANQTLLFCLPGSTGACRTAWEKILRTQLDSDTRPCNFVQIMEAGCGTSR